MKLSEWKRLQKIPESQVVTLDMIGGPLDGQRITFEYGDGSRCLEYIVYDEPFVVRYLIREDWKSACYSGAIPRKERLGGWG